MEFLNPDSIVEVSKSFFPLLTKLLDWTISSLVYMFPFIMIGLGFKELSNRYKYDNWSDMWKANKKKYKDSFKDCGVVVNIDLDEGWFLSNSHVTIKTDRALYRCIGKITNVKIGSKVRSQMHIPEQTCHPFHAKAATHSI